MGGGVGGSLHIAVAERWQKYSNDGIASASASALMLLKPRADHQDFGISVRITVKRTL